MLPSLFPRQIDSKKKQRGFTLIELIIVIVLLGIVGAMGASFISQAFKGFFDTDIRMEMYEEGKTALVRMEREIHIAVPNAVDVSIAGDTVSFGVIDESAMAGVFGQYTEVHPTGGISITDQTGQRLDDNTLISIYNTGWDVFADSSRIYNIDHHDGSGKMYITPETVPPVPPLETIGPASPYGRYYAVRPEAVRFYVDTVSHILYRTTATVTAGSLGTFTTVPAPPILAKNVIQSDGLPYFTYEPGTSTRNSVVVIHFAIKRTETDETVNFHKEVQIRNVP